MFIFKNIKKLLILSLISYKQYLRNTYLGFDYSKKGLSFDYIIIACKFNLLRAYFSRCFSIISGYFSTIEGQFVNLVFRFVETRFNYKNGEDFCSIICLIVFNFITVIIIILTFEEFG